MNKLLDNGLVALALIASVGYALSSLGPKALRRRLWTALARLAASAPAGMQLKGIARRLEEAAAKSSGACGGCGSCGSETSDSSAANGGAASGEVASGRAPEVRVPLESIGKRRQNG
ncbi:MAG: DUF6587 family protein [Steroidobacteraceae bacterium]|jgi:hypothetical protein